MEEDIIICSNLDCKCNNEYFPCYGCERIVPYCQGGNTYYKKYCDECVFCLENNLTHSDLKSDLKRLIILNNGSNRKTRKYRIRKAECRKDV